MVIALALITGAFAVRSTQVAVTLVLLVLLLAIRSQSRTAGLMTLWTYWLLAPAIRRLLDLAVAAPAADPLSLLPFAGTAMLAVMELRENRLDRRARTILSMGLVGFLLGVPIGLAADPAAVSFGLMAYGAGLSAFVLGWGDQVRGALTLQRVFTVALPALAFYGIVQYFTPLTAWDAHWVETADLSSIGAPQEGHIRIFATLNSPFTFAMVLAVGLLLAVGAYRRLSVSLVATLPLAVALALTFVRSAWLALVVGVVVYAAAARGRAAGRVVAIIGICLAALVVVGGSNPTTKAFTERVTSLGNPEKDVSAQDRLEITNRLVPAAVSQPLGAGIGQAGLSVRLEESGDSNLVSVNDGYLSLLYQSGPFGLLLIVAAMVASVVAAVQAMGRVGAEDRQGQAAVLATISMLLIAEVSGDVLFGAPGVIFWYLCGLAVAAASRQGDAEAAGEHPINAASASSGTMS